MNPAAIAGALLIGKPIASNLLAKRLRQGFGMMVLAVGVTVLWRNLIG